MIKRINAGKWIKLGITKKEYDKIRGRARSKAQGIISKRRRKEYLKIVKKLMNEEYKFYSKIVGR